MSKKIILILSIFLITGCYDRQELNNIAILTATEINKVNDNFIVSVQIVNPAAKNEANTSPFVIYEGTGKTIQESYRQINQKSPRRIYPDHIQLMIINEKIAKEDIKQIIDFYQRTPSIRTEFKVLIGKSDNILSLTTPLDKLSSSSILESLESSSQSLGIANIPTFNDLTNNILNPNIELTLPSITIENEQAKEDNITNVETTNIKSKYKIDTLAIFKENKLQDYLTKDESITYNIIKNNIKNIILTYKCEDNKYISLETLSTNSLIKPQNKEINIYINIKASINESNCNINLNNNKEINSLETNIQNYLTNNLIININNIRNKYNSDIFGFLDEIYKHDYNNYLNLYNNWYNYYYKEIKINPLIKLKIVSKGNILEENYEKNY